MYDSIIIGGGPAGLTAAIYAARYGLKVAVLAKDFGQISKSPIVENYPGTESTTGMDLIMRFRKHLEKFKIPMKTQTVLRVEKKPLGFNVVTDKETYETKTILLATGTYSRKLGIGEEKYIGKGVSYCTTCDAPFYKKKTVAVIGGSNAAVTAAIHLSNFAKKVILLYRKAELRAEAALIDSVKKRENVEIATEVNVIELVGKTSLTSIKLDSKKELKIDGLFIEIGYILSNHIAIELGLKLDDDGHIKVDQTQMTSMQGVFAAGDLTTASNKLKQIITAAAEGAIAANSIFKYLNNAKSQSHSKD